MKKLTTIIPFLLVFTLSCENYDLTDNIFIPDKENSDLPAYSEWGYNTFGVMVDRKPFVNDRLGIPGKIINTEGTTTFMLIGHINGYDYADGAGSDMLLIELPDFSPRLLADLMLLNNTTIDLRDPDCRVIFSQDDVENELQILSGTLHFKRTQNLVVDKEPSFIIVSGTFEFQALLDNFPVSFSSGRFDISFNSDNFFYY